MRSKEGNTMSKHYEQRKEANARWAAKKERFYMYLDPEDKEDFAAYAKAKGHFRGNLFQNGKGSFLCPRAPVPLLVIIGDCVKRILRISLPLYVPDF